MLTLMHYRFQNHFWLLTLWIRTLVSVISWLAHHGLPQFLSGHTMIKSGPDFVRVCTQQCAVINDKEFVVMWDTWIKTWTWFQSRPDQTPKQKRTFNLRKNLSWWRWDVVSRTRRIYNVVLIKKHVLVIPLTYTFHYYCACNFWRKKMIMLIGFFSKSHIVLRLMIMIISSLFYWIHPIW